MTEIQTPVGDDMIHAVQAYGILLTQELDGWHWQSSADAAAGLAEYKHGPFASELAAAEDFASGSDDFTLSLVDADEL